MLALPSPLGWPESARTPPPALKNVCTSPARAFSALESGVDWVQSTEELIESHDVPTAIALNASVVSGSPANPVSVLGHIVLRGTAPAPKAESIAAVINPLQSSTSTGLAGSGAPALT